MPKSGSRVGRSHCLGCIVIVANVIAASRSRVPKMLKAHTADLAKRELRNTNGIAANASIAVTRSPNGDVSEKYLLNPIRTSVLSANASAFSAQQDLTSSAARYVSIGLSRSERARHLRGGGRPTRFVYQSFSFERGLRCGGARPVLRLFVRIGERSAK